VDVFGFALAAGGDVLRDAAIDAAYELGVFDALAEPRTLGECAAAIDLTRGVHRLRALADVLVAIGALARDGERFACAVVPPRPSVPRAGWGLAAEVIRRNQPLDVAGGETELRYHLHLTTAGAPAARELARHLRGGALLDLGGGAGTYTAAFLDEHREARATIVDYREVITLARRHLARFGDRVRFVASEISSAELGDAYDVVLLANVLHLHDPWWAAKLCAVAARVTAPGGVVVIKELRVDDDRRGPLEGLMFALNMALYTGGGDVYTTAQLRAWLANAGLADAEELRLAAAPAGIVLVARATAPPPARAAFEAATGLASSAAAEALRLDDALAATVRAGWRACGRDDAPPALAIPPPLRTMLAHAVTSTRHAHADPAPLVTHYTETMPRMRLAQLAEPPALFAEPLDWARLPRMTAALDALFALLAACDVDAEPALGVPTADAFRAATPTFAALYARTHYGRLMPLLYGYPADLAYFTRRGGELGLDTLGTIDRYLVAPMIHELCHFAPTRDALLPPHLDECIAGWLGVHAWPELAYPEGAHDDAIYGAPWLAQVGQAVARAFGVRAVVRAQAGAEPWDRALPPASLGAVTRFGWDDWCARRSSHLLSDTLAPEPWVALALDGGVPEDDAFDRAIVHDALAAMCLADACIDGSFRTRTRLPPTTIAIDAARARVTASSGAGMRYWLPPHVARRLRRQEIGGYTLRLDALAAIPAAAAAIVDALPGLEADGFRLYRRSTEA